MRYNKPLNIITDNGDFAMVMPILIDKAIIQHTLTSNYCFI